MVLVSKTFVIESGGLQGALDALAQRGYQIIGPTVSHNAIVYEPIRSVDDLPKGWTETQEGGVYRLEKTDSELLFNFGSTQDSWKKVLFPSVHRLWKAERENGDFRVLPESGDVPQMALFGVRSCDLRAIQIQDKVFMGGPYADANYKARRERTFVLAVNCGKPGGTCFCVSMGAGPGAVGGYDLAMTEVASDGRHYFVVEVGSARGEEILNATAHREATEKERGAAKAVVEEASRHMGRNLDTRDLRALLGRNYEHPRWEETAKRCLTCANCTLVCPTCFCSTVQDMTDLSGQKAERWRKLDSCYLLDFSYIHGGSVRASESSRYRQWIMHKLGTWMDQFGTLGCVGCGRCITWCPVAIDITEEVDAVRKTEHGRKEEGDATG